jgi:hypothetical protein
MAKSLYEARLLARLATEYKVATQMGNQGTANADLREAAAILKSGALGKVSEVHVWTNRPVWPQGLDRPESGEEVPATVHWPEWIGPAEMRPYHSAYHPFKWRGWWAFGTGALGDMACHTLNMPYMGLDLRDPTSLQAVTSGHNLETYPVVGDHTRLSRTQWPRGAQVHVVRRQQTAETELFREAEGRLAADAGTGQTARQSSMKKAGRSTTNFTQDDQRHSSSASAYCSPATTPVTDSSCQIRDCPKVDFVRSPAIS